MKNDTEGVAKNLVERCKHFVDSALVSFTDRYSNTPLLIDGLNPETGEPKRWEDHVLSNFACHQNFLRTTVALSTITGDPTYRDWARGLVRYALSMLQDPASGMLYWGGHSSWDLAKGKPMIGNHELKCVYPYYTFMYEVDPERTRLAIEGFWNKHVRNWSNLLFNRHGEYEEWDMASPWKHEYEGGPTPIIENDLLSFINTGSDLIYAASILSEFDDDPEPLLWARRLAGRYEDIRNPDTGLAGYQFNHREPCRVRISFKRPLGDRGDVNETTVITNGVIRTRYGRAALTLLNLCEGLEGPAAEEFLDIVVSDLTSLAKYSYDEEDHSFSPLLTSGEKLEPKDCLEGVGYCSPRKLQKVSADGLMFCAYARAYRITGNELFLEMVTSISEGLGDPYESEAPPEKTRLNDPCIVFGLLELYRATDDRAFLSTAAGIAQRVAKTGFSDGLLVPDREGWATIDSHLPLSLIHVAAAIRGQKDDLPVFYPGYGNFDPKVIIALRGS